MTVWTNVSLDEANEWLLERNLGQAAALSPIEDGVEDSVFRLDLTDGTRTFLRLFERTEALGPLSIATHLAACGLSTCPPIEDDKKRVHTPLKGKPASLFPWVEGAWVEKPSLSQIAEIGVFMGRMARDGAVQCAAWQRENPRGWAWFEETTQQVIPVLDEAVGRELEAEMTAQKTYWHRPEANKIPRGPVHADLFRNNVMFKPDGTLGAVIDWGFCASDTPLVYDLAIVANDWCLQKESFDLDEKKLNALMKARESVLPLTKVEKEHWPMALRLAALRFYLSRAFDYYLPRSSGGKAHDPLHFWEILRARKKL